SGLAATSPEVISPVIIGGTSGSVPRPMASQSSTQGTLGQLPASYDKGSAGEVVHGFAKGVPLAVALRQILPTGYAFSIDQGVDTGTLVAFQGGKPWRETLRSALAPVGLALREQGQMVSIGFPSSAKAETRMTPATSYQGGGETRMLQPVAEKPYVSATSTL